MSDPSSVPLSHRIFDTAFLFAVAAAAATLLDIFLPKKWKQRINSGLDSLTLRLDDIKPAEFLQRWLRTSRRAAFAHILFGLFSIAAILAPAIFTGILFFEEGFNWLGVGLILLVLVIQSWAWSQSAKVFDTLGEDILKSLEKAQTVGEFVLKYLGFAVAGAIVIVALGALAFWILDFLTYESFWFRIFQVAMNFYIGLVVTWIVMFLDGLITLMVAALIIPIRMLVTSAKWFMWRLSEFSRGPLAALMAVFVSVLALVKALMRW